jgi:4-amino-4-deoxy-L-arabinose transferase-like glycosyltransferase
MFALLTLLPWMTATFVIARAGRATGPGGPNRGDWRDAMLLAAVYWSAALVVVTEALGAFHALRPVPVRFVWAAAGLGCVIWILRGRLWQDAFAESRIRFPAWDVAVIGAMVALLAALAFTVAALTSPGYPDVLGYHLPRQVMWLQQGSLDFFATTDQKQLRMPPFSEMVGLHLLALNGGDADANLPQFFAYLLTIVAMTVIVRELGGGLRAQLLAAFLWAAIPMAYQEASNGKNDLITAFWVGILAWQALRAWDVAGAAWKAWLPVGCALGLCWLTKGTGLVYSFPIIAVAGWGVLRSGRRNWARFAAAIAVAVLLCAGHYLRNLSWYGTPLGRADSAEQDEMNKAYAPAAIASNVTRDLALELGTPSDRANRAILSAIEAFHRRIGEDPNDPRTSLVPIGDRYGVAYHPNLDSLSSAPAQTLLALVLPAWMFLRRRALGKKAWILLALGVVAGLALAIAVKWQPWGTRLQLPIFALVVPIFGIVGTGPGGRIGRLGWLAGALALAALLPALNIYQRPLWGPVNIFSAPRDEIQFRFWPSLRQPDREIADLLLDDRVRCIRFAMRQMHWTYPMMRRLIDKRAAPPFFWGPKDSPSPDAVITYAGDDELPVEASQPGTSEGYIAVGSTYPYSLHVRRSLIDEGAVVAKLPSFVGWTGSLGLATATIGRGDWKTEGRIPSAKAIRLFAPFEKGPLRLRAAVRVLRTPEAFSVAVNGNAVFTDTIGLNETRELDVDVGTGEGDREITIEPAAPSWEAGNLIFLSLRIVDPQRLPESLSAAK